MGTLRRYRTWRCESLEELQSVDIHKTFGRELTDAVVFVRDVGEFVWDDGWRSNNLGVNTQNGTEYRLKTSDNGKTVLFSNGSAVTVTIPRGLGNGFSCLLVQIGAGTVSVAADGVTLNQRQGQTSSAGQYAMMSLVAYGQDAFVLGGDLA